MKARPDLSPEQKNILENKGTEYPFSGQYLDHHADGTYSCVNCGTTLFSSKDKFDSGTGWPSFHRPISEDAVKYHLDTSHGMIRTEVTCGNCGGHLGHVFASGQNDTAGQHFCINSCILEFGEQS